MLGIDKYAVIRGSFFLKKKNTTRLCEQDILGSISVDNSTCQLEKMISIDSYV